MTMTSNRNKRKFNWWPGDSEWLVQKVDKWLIPGNGYSKLRASISTKSCNTVVEEEPKKSEERWRRDHQKPSNAQVAEPTSKFKMCLKYGENVYKNYSDKLNGRQRSQMAVSRSFSSKEGKKTITRQDWARSSYSLKRRNADENPVSFSQRGGSFRSKTMQRFTSSVVPTEVIFEKCRPKHRPNTRPCRNQDLPCCVQSDDIIYYPFREEDCVVCNYIFENANHFRMSVEPLQHVACTTDGCHFLYGSKSFPCNTGQLHAGCNMTPCTTLVNNMSKCSLRETRIASDSPGAKAFYEKSYCKKTQPTINISQDFIEVRYDESIDDITNNNSEPVRGFASPRDSESESEVEIQRKPARPPPTYMNVIRREGSYVRPRKCTYQHQNGEDRFYIHGSPLLNNTRVPDARETYYRHTNSDDNRVRANHNLNGHRRTNTLPLPRSNVFRETPKYRSQGRFAHSFYDTEQAVRNAFEINGNCNNGMRRGNSFTYHRPAPSFTADNQSPVRFQLREVDLKSRNPLRNVMSFRNSGSKSSRRKKSVVVGEDGFQGPMWPRVLLTFDRGVTPNAPTTSVGQTASMELDA